MQNKEQNIKQMMELMPWEEDACPRDSKYPYLGKCLTRVNRKSLTLTMEGKTNNLIHQMINKIIPKHIRGL